MTDEFRQSLDTVLKDIVEELKVVYGNTYRADISAPIHNCIGINAVDFYFVYTIDEKCFYISFVLDTPACITAEIMRIITTFILPSDIIVLHDNYYSKETDTMLYGQPAIEAKQKETMKRRGHAKCVICERVFEKRYIKSNGYCPDCDSKKDKFTFH